MATLPASAHVPFIQSSETPSKTTLNVWLIMAPEKQMIMALTHFPEDIGTLADVAQQLAVGDDHVVVGRVPLPEKTKKKTPKDST